MSSENSLKDNAPDEEKRKRHAQAQREYRERNLEVTRAKARERMADLREVRSQSAKKRWLAAKKRRETDADYREQLRRDKFVSQFGYDAFLDIYYPQYKLHGTKHLAGVRSPWEEAAAKKAEADKKKSKRKLKKVAG
ncbi:hypothetical protein C8R43DRAFT_1124399 [Mycena crocata]|nr:hypothetical protein C8R43DRAFT_1143011 [Mycena crocata]KAJ7147201.1 hypothetical protein C8R43DRAFT_953378 [Mycena crocata]KAJ7159179.1 hypothetical protein C8R43DRAFT_1124399 [Mycena crocata]